MASSVCRARHFTCFSGCLSWAISMRVTARAILTVDAAGPSTAVSMAWELTIVDEKKHSETAMGGERTRKDCAERR